MKKTSLIKGLSAAVALTVAACNNPAAPEEQNQFKPLVPLYEEPVQNPIQTAPADEFDSWKQVAEFDIAIERDGVETAMGWCPVFTRNGTWPHTLDYDSAFVVLPTNERVFLGSVDAYMCINGTSRRIPGIGIVHVDGCREPQVSVRENPRVIPGMEDR